MEKNRGKIKNYQRVTSFLKVHCNWRLGFLNEEVIKVGYHEGQTRPIEDQIFLALWALGLGET